MTVEDTIEYEQFVEAEDAVGTSSMYVEAEEHTIGRITGVETEELDQGKLLRLSVDVDGVEHEAIIHESSLVDGLPSAATSYPNVNRLSDLAERRVPVTGTGGAAVVLDEFRGVYVKNATLSKKEQWECLQHGLVSRTDNGWFQTTGSLSTYERISKFLFFAGTLIPTLFFALFGAIFMFVGLQSVGALIILLGMLTMFVGWIPSRLYRIYRDELTSLPV